MNTILCGINAKYIHSNLAIYDLKSYATMHSESGVSISLKEYTINHYIEYILRDLYEAKPDLLVFSCYIWNISYVTELAAELKKVLPGLAIWVGGPEVSYHAPVFLQEQPAIDLVMCGEGEEVFCQLLDRFAQNGSFEDEIIAGAVYRGDHGIINGGFAPIMNLDEVPFVYDDFELFSHKILYYESSRGCPFSCSYCLSSVDKSIRFRSLEKVFAELDLFLEAKVPQVKFVDRTFNCDKKRAVEIWTYITEHDNGVTNFHFEVSSDLLDEAAFDIFQKMRPGLIQLEIGVQSTNSETVTAIRRRMDLDKVFANVDRVKALGNIHQHLDLIAGLPNETLDAFKISFNDVYAHRPDQLQLGFLKVLHGTFMESKIAEYDLKYRSQPPYEVLSTKWLSFDDVNTLKGVEELVEMYYNSGQYANILEYAVPRYASPYEFYQAFSFFYQTKGYHQMNHNRLKKYEILREFLLTEWQAGRMQGNLSDFPILCDELLLLDLYLRENVKSRPAWSREYTVNTATLKSWYKEKGGDYLAGAEGKYDSRKAANKSHMEAFSFDLMQWLEEKKIVATQCFCLFDYEIRNPLNDNCRTVMLRDLVIEK